MALLTLTCDERRKRGLGLGLGLRPPARLGGPAGSPRRGMGTDPQHQPRRRAGGRPRGPDAAAQSVAASLLRQGSPWADWGGSDPPLPPTPPTLPSPTPPPPALPEGSSRGPEISASAARGSAWASGTDLGMFLMNITRGAAAGRGVRRGCWGRAGGEAAAAGGARAGVGDGAAARGRTGARGGAQRRREEGSLPPAPCALPLPAAGRHESPGKLC